MKKKSFIKRAKTTGANLEQRFNDNKDVLDYFDTKNLIRKINIDLPSWAIEALDREAERRGITRQSLMKTWLIDQIDKIKKPS